MIRRPPRSTQGVSSAASDVYKRQGLVWPGPVLPALPWPAPAATTTTTTIINIMGGPFPSAKGSTPLSALPPTFVGGIYLNTWEFSLPQSSRPLPSAILHFMELMAYRATPTKWHPPQVVRSTTEDVPPGAAAPSGTLNRGRRTSGGRGPQWYAQPRKMYQLSLIHI